MFYVYSCVYIFGFSICVREVFRFVSFVGFGFFSFIDFRFFWIFYVYEGYVGLCVVVYNFFVLGFYEGGSSFLWGEWS